MHVVDRVCGRQFLLGPEEKEAFRILLHRLVRFTGLELLTWTCLDNHFHLLLRVPNAGEAAQLRASLCEADLFERMRGAFSASYLQELRWRIEAFRREGRPEMAESILRRLRAQLYDVSAFMHMLKRRFSAYYNQKHGRKGTLWEGRFRSVLVEEDEESLLRMAAYIDLNAVRAGIVKDPKDYRWSGYGEATGSAGAVAGREEARQGVRELVSAACGLGELPSWEEARAAYGDWLYESLPARQECPAHGGRLSKAQLLHCRVRYFADGLALGSRGFVEEVFARYRGNFGARRSSGARPLRWGEWAGLCSLRDLQKEVIRGPGSG